MSALKADAMQVAALKTLVDEIAKFDKPARAKLLADMQEIGAEKITAELPDGTVVASVSVAGGQGVKAFVTDDRAFLAWVKDNRPTEVEERVSDAFKKRFLDDLAKTGETVPGVDLTDARPYISTRFKPEGRDAIAAAWAEGTLSLGQILALPAGGEEQ
jgi:hypothetical protein